MNDDDDGLLILLMNLSAFFFLSGYDHCGPVYHQISTGRNFFYI